MQKVFASRLKENTFSFFEDDVNHLKNILRMQINDELVCIYEQNKYLTKIVKLDPLLAEIIEPISENTELNGIDVTLYQAVIKPKHFEWILSKSTELQVSQITPVLFDRSQKTNLINESRMQTIIQTAAKQSSRNVIPSLNELIKSKQLIEQLNKFDLVILPFESRQETNLGNILDKFNNVNLSKIAIIIGPEGGFSNEEISLLTKLDNVKMVSLTKTILRSETASFYTLSVLMDWLLKRGY